MIKNVKYEVSILDLLLEIKRKWKVICAFMLAFMLLCGGYKVVSNNPKSQQGINEEEYAENMELYNSYLSAQEDLPDSLKLEWERLYHDRVENPIFSVDPYKCEYEQIVVLFDEKGSNHDWAVNNWILTADNEALFGSQENTLSDYKSVLVSTVWATEGQVSNTCETAVQIIAVNNFDTDKATTYLIKHFKKSAADEGINIVGVSKSKAKGYNERVANYQEKNRGKLTALYSSLDYFNKMNQFFAAPNNPAMDQSIYKKIIIKYCIMGLVLGFIIGVALVVFNIIRRRQIISSHQIEDAFDLALLSDCSSEKEASFDVLNANLDIMTSENSTIMVVADGTMEELENITSRWTEASTRLFIACTDLFENPETIERLKTINGIVLGVKLGESKLEQLQRVVLRAEKLNQKVIGYVIL